jgi:hypothetical protein
MINYCATRGDFKVFLGVHFRRFDRRGVLHLFGHDDGMVYDRYLRSKTGQRSSTEKSEMGAEE